VVSLNDAKPEQHLVKSANNGGQIKLGSRSLLWKSHR
jgi:hypothetical protein